MSQKIDRIVGYVERGIDEQIASRRVTPDEERWLYDALESMLRRRRERARGGEDEMEADHEGPMWRENVARFARTWCPPVMIRVSPKA